MARPVRVEVAGGLYHVMVRGNERRAVGRLESVLDNHVRLAIETGKAHELRRRADRIAGQSR